MGARKLTMDDLANVAEVIELANRWNKVYLEILKRTGDKQQAIEAVEFLIKMDEDRKYDPAN